MAKKNNTTLDDLINDVYTESTDSVNKVKNTSIEVQETVNNLDDVTELKTIVEQAIPIRTEVLTDNTQDMNEVRNDFASLITDKLNAKKDKELKKYYNKVFKTVKDYLYYQGGYPKENSKGKGEKLAELISMIVPWLQYIDKWSVVEKYLLESGISITNAIPLENRIEFSFLKDDSIKNTIKGYFKEGQDIQDKICQNNDNIIKECYENLPTTIKYDKDENPTGLKAAQFNKLVNVTAKMQLEADKKDEIQDKAVYQLECLQKSTQLLADSIVSNA